MFSLSFVSLSQSGQAAELLSRSRRHALPQGEKNWNNYLLGYNIYLRVILQAPFWRVPVLLKIYGYSPQGTQSLHRSWVALLL